MARAGRPRPSISLDPLVVGAARTALIATLSCQLHGPPWASPGALRPPAGSQARSLPARLSGRWTSRRRQTTCKPRPRQLSCGKPHLDGAVVAIGHAAPHRPSPTPTGSWPDRGNPAPGRDHRLPGRLHRRRRSRRNYWSDLLTDALHFLDVKGRRAVLGPLGSLAANALVPAAATNGHFYGVGLVPATRKPTASSRLPG